MRCFACTYTSADISSRYYTQDGGNGTDPVVFRNNQFRAQEHANQLRLAHEFPRIAGSLTIPYITPRFNLGDQGNQIGGRGVSLQPNIGIDQGETPVYPRIVGVSWTSENDRQATTLQLSDKRADPRNGW
jgi:hypothetical protein